MVSREYPSLETGGIRASEEALSALLRRWRVAGGQGHDVQCHVEGPAIIRLCSLPEEDPSPLELVSLKWTLGMNETWWRASKSKFGEEKSPKELV